MTAKFFELNGRELNGDRCSIMPLIARCFRKNVNLSMSAIWIGSFVEYLQRVNCRTCTTCTAGISVESIKYTRVGSHNLFTLRIHSTSINPWIWKWGLNGFQLCWYILNASRFPTTFLSIPFYEYMEGATRTANVAKLLNFWWFYFCSKWAVFAGHLQIYSMLQRWKSFKICQSFSFPT